jgi:hypothetical protein
MLIWSSLDRTYSASIQVRPTAYGFTAAVVFTSKLPFSNDKFRCTQGIGYHTRTREDAIHGALQHFKFTASTSTAYIAWNTDGGAK